MTYLLHVQEQAAQEHPCQTESSNKLNRIIILGARDSDRWHRRLSPWAIEPWRNVAGCLFASWQPPGTNLGAGSGSRGVAGNKNGGVLPRRFHRSAEAAVYQVRTVENRKPCACAD